MSVLNCPKSRNGASLYIDKEYLGEIEVLETDLIDFELNFALLIGHATLKKEYTPLNKFPRLSRFIDCG